MPIALDGARIRDDSGEMSGSCRSISAGTPEVGVIAMDDLLDESHDSRPDPYQPATFLARWLGSNTGCLDVKTLVFAVLTCEESRLLTNPGFAW